MWHACHVINISSPRVSKRSLALLVMSYMKACLDCAAYGECPITALHRFSWTLQ